MTESPHLSPDTASPSSLHAALDFLARLTQVLASNTELQPVLDWMVEKTAHLLSADEGTIRLLDPSEIDKTPHTIVRKGAGLQAGSWERPVAVSVMGYLLTKAETLSSPDLLADTRFPGLRTVDSRVRSVLAAPLRVEDRITGMLAVTNRTPGRLWTPGEVQLLSIVAAYSGGAIDQARLREARIQNIRYEEEQKRMEEEQKRMEEELRRARRIQMGLVPSGPLTQGPWEVHGRVVPARQVGGDYFDYFPLGGERFGATIADVSGKGLPAAIMMSSVQASLRAFCDGGLLIPDAISRVNRNLTRSANPGTFITLFYAEVDWKNQVLRYTNAGHNYPLLRRASGVIEELVAGGFVLGVFEDARYELGETRFAPGDSLLLYSDGISEAMDGHDRDYGEDRLRAVWQRCATGPVADVLPTLFNDVESFRGSAGQSDDMTAVVIGSTAG
jgi:sigma-B regulation protein RsbU (phosphoserine phosphatase)